MTAAVFTYDTSEMAGEAIADRILLLLEAKGHGKPFLLGCPGGRSPKPVYNALADKAAQQGLDLSNLIIVMMDEYVLGHDDDQKLPDRNAHFSCRGFGERDILGLINASLPESCQIPARNLWLPDLSDPLGYDQKIADAGGVDYFILASGAGDGHIAFNPPGAERASRTRVVRLARQTQIDNLSTFPEFCSVDDVPEHGLTVGIGTIADQSHEVGLILWGADKTDAFQRITRAKAYEPSWPATIASVCKRAAIHADRAAAGKVQNGA